MVISKWLSGYADSLSAWTHRPRWRCAMDMEVTAWMSMYHAMNAEEDRRPFSRATLRRIAGFARPHRRRLVRFLLLSVVTAVLAVATPPPPPPGVRAIVQGGGGRF